MKIIEAAKKLEIPYENAKAIYRTYKIEGRFSKKLYKKREKDYQLFMQMQEIAAQRYEQNKIKQMAREKDGSHE
jgi:hypothetical protein